MRPILDILTSRWCVSFIGIALLAGVVWFFAPLLPGFEDWPPRLALLAALLLAWGGGNALLDIRRRRRDAALTRGIASSPEADEEAQALRARLTTALGLLRKSLGSRGYLYEQPLVRDHRSAGSRQDDGTAERRAAVSAGGSNGTGRCFGHRRHAAMRLVVHRRCRADRHRRALHHAGLQRGNRSHGLGHIPRPA